jgi:hypothetical protein
VCAGKIDDLRKGIWIVDGKIGEGLTVELDLGALEAVNEFAIAHATHPRSSADTDYPKAPEHPLADAPITKSKYTTANEGDQRLANQVVAAEPEPLGQTA